jgi:uncharacterized delta-60 repeat protein
MTHPVLIPGAQPDPTFSSDGKLELGFGTPATDDYARAVAVMADGRYVVAGSAGNDFAVARYNADGTLDTSFSGDGKQTTDISGVDNALAMAVQSDGKVIVVGSADDGSNLVVVRYTANGDLDTSFNGTGVITTSIASSTTTETNTAVLVQPDGSIVVAGYTGSTYLIQRYTAAGVLDTGFSGDGKETANFAGTKYSEIQAMVRQSDGKLLVAGNVYQGSNNYDFAVARYNTDGTLDTTFNTTGKQVFSYNAYDHITDIKVQSDGKILLAGYTGSSSSSTDGVLVRLTAAGSLDSSFDGDGIARLDLAANDQFNSLDIEADGKILVGGSSGSDALVARFNTSGSLDTSFNTTGSLGVKFGESDSAIHDAEFTADGKWIAVGESYSFGSNPSGYDFGALRLTGGLSNQLLMASAGSIRPAGSPPDAINYQVPANVFFDADGDTLSYTATLANGNALPSWLSFDAATRTFTGTPGVADFGGYEVSVTANDNHGGTVSGNFLINVKDDFMNAVIEKDDGRWNVSSARGTPIEITYSFIKTGTGNGHSGSSEEMSDVQKAAVRVVLANYAAVSGLTFREVADSGTLRYGTVTSNPSWTGEADMPLSSKGYSELWFNRTYLDADGVADGSRPLGTMTHETGHALGLQHPGLNPGDAGANVVENFGLTDMRTNSVMSYVYRDDATINTSTGAEIYPSTPMRWDVASIQYLYGVNHSFNAGDNVYTYDPAVPFFKNIWDGGGNDTINISSYTFASTLSLIGGTFSSLHTMASQPGDAAKYWGTDNLSISYNAIIENAIGGAGADTLIGNDVGNRLQGNAGNDT